MSRAMRTNNPSEWTALDGIYIDEIKPPGRITSKGSAVVAIIGQFQKGPYEITTIGSAAQLLNTFGSGDYEGFKSLLSKSFSNLVIGRVKGGATAKSAFSVLNDDDVVTAPSIQGTATSDGIWGNLIKLKSLAATSGDAAEFNVLATNTGTGESYLFQDLTLASLPVSCSFVTLSKSEGADKIPKLDQEVTLSQGSDGTPATADYVDVMTRMEAYDGITLVFTDSATDDVNLKLIEHCNKMGDRVPIFHFAKGTAKADAITKVSALRGASDRGIAAWPWLYQYNLYKDVTELSNPAAWAASAISQLGEEIDPAVADAAVYFAGVKGLEYPELNRTDYIELKNAGIMAFEWDKDIGYKIKSGITVSTDPALVMVFRRRMTDKITSECASGLKPYQNKIMTDTVKTDILGAISRYLQDLKDKSRIEKFQVDGVSMNTEISLANGEYHILIYVKLFASMRYIVLHAQVGETVLIQERSAA